MRASYRIIVIAMTISCLLCCSLSAAGPGHEKSRTNVALGKKYTFNKTTQTTAFRPSQGSSTATQLTDGKYGETGGWHRQPVVSVTIDLGQVEPVSGLSYSTAGGVAWPAAISLFVGDDGQGFYYVGDVIRLSAKRGLPSDGDSTHRYIAEGLVAKGRYVRLMIRAAYAGFTPVYLSETDVTAGKHWEAVREGVEDYEYLCMLRDRIKQLQAKPEAAAAVAKAREVLRNSLDQVVPGQYDQTDGAYQWDRIVHGGLPRDVVEGQLFGPGSGPGKDRSLADKARLEILTMLERLQRF